MRKIFHTCMTNENESSHLRSPCRSVGEKELIGHEITVNKILSDVNCFLIIKNNTIIWL